MSPLADCRCAACAWWPREEYRRALETRWLFGFTALFAVLVLGLSYFGLAQSREVGFQGFARVTLSLMNLVLLIVPLTGLLLGVTSIAGGGDTLPLLLAQPVSRGEVLVGKFLGLGAALGVAQALGFGARRRGDRAQRRRRSAAGLRRAHRALDGARLAHALGSAVHRRDLARPPAGDVVALLLWLLMVVAYDLVVLGATALLSGLPLQTVLFPALLLNPVDLCRVLITLAVGSRRAVRPDLGGAGELFGTARGVALGLVVLAIETAVPLIVGDARVPPARLVSAVARTPARPTAIGAPLRDRAALSACCSRSARCSPRSECCRGCCSRWA